MTDAMLWVVVICGALLALIAAPIGIYRVFLGRFDPQSYHPRLYMLMIIAGAIGFGAMCWALYKL